jgi:DNA modification methylase
MYEVFDIPIINGKENTTHSTTKPIKVITRLVKTSTNEGASVLDMFGGSGPTLEACMNTNRNCTLFELSDEWVPDYKKRLVSDNSKLTDTWGCYTPQR